MDTWFVIHSLSPNASDLRKRDPSKQVSKTAILKHFV